jgi:hypothetical protein
VEPQRDQHAAGAAAGSSFAEAAAALQGGSRAHPLVSKALARLLAAKPALCAALRPSALGHLLSLRVEVALLVLCQLLRADERLVPSPSVAFEACCQAISSSFQLHSGQTLQHRPQLWQDMAAGRDRASEPAFVAAWWAEPHVKLYIMVSCLLSCAPIAGANACSSGFSGRRQQRAARPAAPWAACGPAALSSPRCLPGFLPCSRLQEQLRQTPAELGWLGPVDLASAGLMPAPGAALAELQRRVALARAAAALRAAAREPAPELGCLPGQQQAAEGGAEHSSEAAAGIGFPAAAAELQASGRASCLINKALARLLADKPAFCAALQPAALGQLLALQAEVALLVLCQLARADEAAIGSPGSYFSTCCQAIGSGFHINRHRALRHRRDVWQDLSTAVGDAKEPAFVNVWWAKLKLKRYIEVGGAPAWPPYSPAPALGCGSSVGLWRLGLWLPERAVGA